MKAFSVMVIVCWLVTIGGGMSFGVEDICFDGDSVLRSGAPVYPYYTNLDSMEINIQACFLQHDITRASIGMLDYYEALDELEEDYDGTGISFSVQDSILFFAVPDSVYNGTQGIIVDYLDSETSDPDFITIYFLPPDLTARTGWAFGIPGKRFVVGGDGVLGAISHEMGHALGLLHTFETDENYSGGADYPGPENCESHGDQICDTPASFLLNSSNRLITDPETCEYSRAFIVADSLSEYTWTPSRYNQMEYTADPCRQEFTDEQVFRMKSAVEIDWGGLDDVLSQSWTKSLPEIATSAEFPIIASSNDTSTVIAVSVSHPNGYDDMLVIMDATNLGGPSDILLLDDGVFPDLVDDDGIYTSPPLDINTQAGTDSVVVAAFAPYADGGNHSYSTESVEVLAEDTMLKFVDGSDLAGDLESSMSGEPYANSYFKTDISGNIMNVLVLSKDKSVDRPEVFRKGNISGGVPFMHNQLVSWFGGVPIPAGGRGTCSADFDNDGDEDLFVCNNSTSTKLFQNTGSGYSDVTGTEFSSAGVLALQGSHVAAWGDYNQDGWIDLFVASVAYTGDMSDIGANPPTTAPTWSHFRNTGAGFELTSGILNATPTESAISATWNDFDGDGDQDLIVGYIDGSSDKNPRVFENQGYKKLSGDFVLEDKSSTKGIVGLSINSMDWIDYNNDDYPDLVVTAFAPQQGALILKNIADTSGRKFDFADSLATEGQWEGASVGDLDQNGEEDIVLLPHFGIPSVFLASSGSPSPTYRERAFTLGLKPTGGSTPAFTSGAAVADFNDDHDLDLYLGRPNSDQFFYRNMRQDGTSDPPGSSNQNWIDIDLATWGNSNSSLIGARIVVEEPNSGKTWIQAVDGGSGRGGQKPNQLHFGLGNETGPVDVSVEWPSGGTADTTGVNVNTQILVTETTTPEVQSSGLIFTHEPFPGGADWVFQWVTTNKGDITLDTVEFRYEPGYFPTSVCTIDVNEVLAWGDSDVEMVVFPATGGWSHRVVWKGQFCSPDETCHFQFKVTSGVEGQSDSSDWVNFGYFDACLKEPQN